MKLMGLLSKIFPIPNYLDFPAVGVDISDRSIKYVELEKTKVGLGLKSSGYRIIEPGVIDKGEIKNKEGLIKHLSDMRRELSNTFVVVSLPEEKAFLKMTYLPLVEDSKIREVLELGLEELVPFSAKEAVFDFDIINRFVKEKKLCLVLSAFPKKDAEDYAQVFETVGLCPIAFEIENQSMYRALVKKEEREAVMIIDFGKTRTSFSIGKAGVVEFSSTVKVAGESIDEALSRSLGMSILEAERLKKRQTLQKNGDKQVLNSIMPVVSVIKDEASGVLAYWQAHALERGFKNKDVKEIIICGGDANMPGLVEYLAYGLKKPVKLADPWSVICPEGNYVPDMEHYQSLMFVSSLGLALRSFSQN